MRTIPNVIFLSGKYFQVMKCFLRNCPVPIEIKMTNVYCKIKLKFKGGNLDFTRRVIGAYFFEKGWKVC